MLLRDALRDRGIRHIHVHLSGTAPAVALLTTDFANRVPGGGRHCWSLTIHGPDEFSDVVNEALAEKVAKAEFAVCTSDYAHSQVMWLVPPESWPKLHVLHSGLDLDRTARSCAPATVRRGDPPKVLTVCKLSPRKGVALLLQAVGDLAEAGVDVELTVVGDGPQRTDLERLTQELGIADRVTFAGAVGHDRIGRYYEEADLFAMASFAAGIPTVLMEAMAYELPVVAPATMGIPELVEPGRSGILFRPGRSDELTQAIRRLAGDPELRRRFGAAGREQVGAEFDVRRCAARLRELFETAA